MSWATITARYAGTCRRCHSAIQVGDRIRYGGRGLTYHMARECGAAQADPAWTEERESYAGRYS